MFLIGLIREGKIPADNRVALTPKQCRWIQENMPDIKVVVQPCSNRCFSDKEYRSAGIELREDLRECDLLLGIKEVPVDFLVEKKTYMFFSHTKKAQPHNRRMLQAIIEKKITLIDFECLEHEDGQRILGFGFFAGIVGAHNGMWAYGRRTGTYNLCRVGECKDYKHLINTYFGLKLPAIKVAVTGSGRVASGVLEIMNLMDIIEVEPAEFLQREFSYPVYVHLKGRDLYEHKLTGHYNREDFHASPQNYSSKFKPYIYQTDILMNGTYWEKNIPRLFNWEDMLNERFRIQTIADISDDKEGSIPCNLGNSTIEFPVYGVDPVSRRVIDPFQKGGVDIMAVSNLPNELPRDASSYFGDQLIKYVLDEIRKDDSPVIERATIVKKGHLTSYYAYLKEYAATKV
ncbi:NAD(P)-dependent oxidoreductase [Segetibacter koreensis]|uniref:NAD(P)-dependent oxidoreductase n=1 Tax=Segetibacter koreensis TaxID=398037 RepID=UPI00035F3799|nr:NAD(P)-dependent oxidoreductase [Segetibacter koreensis]